MQTTISKHKWNEKLSGCINQSHCDVIVSNDYIKLSEPKRVSLMFVTRKIEIPQNYMNDFSKEPF